MKNNFDELFGNINYCFNNVFILRKSLTHRSYRTENNLKFDNQRLEFLGDAVIEIILTEYLFVRYQDDDEGRLTKMRSSFAQQTMLANFARKIDLGKFIYLGKGESESGGRERNSTLCDAFEALMGAVYLDGGLDVARQVLLPMVKACGAEPDELVINLNPKGTLQEFTQKHLGGTPDYELLNIEGPDHSPVYTVKVTVGGREIASGRGNKRKAAESVAAKNALRIMIGNLQESGQPLPDPEKEKSSEPVPENRVFEAEQVN